MNKTAIVLGLVLGLGCAQREPVSQPTVTSPAAAPQAANQIRYQLPPGTWRVTLAITPADQPDWIVSTFVAGAVVTNGGWQTATWDGLDDNGMPVPPGTYRVKGIYMPAEKWKIDGQYHSVIPRYLMSVGDSWEPTKDRDELPPRIYGHQFGGIMDVAVASNGIGAVWAEYIESGKNPFLVDFNKPIGYDQVLASYPSGGTAGGPAVACDGQNVYASCNDGGESFLFRGDRKWGKDRTSIGIPCVKTKTVATRLAISNEFLLAEQPDGVLQIRLTDAAVVATLPAGAFPTIPFVCVSNEVFRVAADGTRTAFGHGFIQPHRVTTWRDHVIVVESKRISEWTADGKLVREWFLCRTGARGYCLDPERPEHVYIADHGVTRFVVDYDKATWRRDKEWPELALGGMQFPQVINRQGQTYLAFPGGYDSQGSFAIYRVEGDQLVPSAGVIWEELWKKGWWWHDANGNGRIDPDEVDKHTKALAGSKWDADFWLNDLSLVVTDPKETFLSNLGFLRLAPSGFDKSGNPIYDGTKWQKLLSDDVYASVRQGKAEGLHGGNEAASGYGSWERLVDDPATGDCYLAYNFGPNGWGGLDSAGVRHCEFKLCRFVPDGQSGYRQKWRVGRKAWAVAQPGEVYGSYHLAPPALGLVGVFDMNGLYHVYTTDGLYVDTLMDDGYRRGAQFANMYAHGGEMWYGKHFLNKKNGKVYLFMGRSGANIYECAGWTAGLTNPIPFANNRVLLTAAQIALPNPNAVKMRGGPSAVKVAKFVASPGGAPALDGSLTGWNTAPVINFKLDDQRQAEVRGMWDPETIYLRWHVRLATKFTPKPLGDATRIFTHDRAMDTVSFYFQGDPDALPTREDARPGDWRVVLAIVEEAGVVKPVALGLYPHHVEKQPVTYVSPTGKITFDRVAVLTAAKLGYSIDPDGLGFVIAAALPAPVKLNSSFRTLVDFDVTLGGVTKFWWANTGKLNNTLTTDEPSEAKFYPGSWAPAEFAW